MRAGWLRRVIKWPLRALAAVVVLVLVLASLLALFSRTDFAKRAVLRAALPAASGLFAGRLHVGRLGGDLLHEVILEDVSLDDAEGQRAITTSRIAARLRLGSLPAGALIVDDVQVEGLDVTARTLQGGALNLAALLKPSPPAPPSPPSNSRFTIDVRRVRVDGRGRFILPTGRDGPPPFEKAETTFTLDGAVKISTGPELVVAVEVARLALGLEAPIAASAHLAARTRLDDKGLALEGDGVRADVDAGGAELRRYLLRLAPGIIVPEAAPGERWAVSIGARGPPERIEAQITVTPPASTIVLNATANLAPIFAGGTALQAIDWSAVLRVEVPDLAKLPGLVVMPPAGGRLRLSARAAQEKGALSVEANAHGEGLRAFGARAGTLDLDVRSSDLASGHAALVVSDLGAGSLRFSGVRLDADGTAQSIALKVRGKGDNHTRFELDATAAPDLPPGGPASVAATLDHFVLSAGKRSIRTRGKTSIHAGADRISIDDFALTMGSQRIRAAGSYQPRDGEIEGRVELRRIDAYELVALVADPGDIPHTKIDAKLAASGTARDPEAKIRLSGESQAAPGLGLPRLRHSLDAAVTKKGARGRLTIHGDGADLSARFALPVDLRPGAPIDAEVDLKLPSFDAIAAFLPENVRGVRGAAELRADVSGTLGRPRVSARLRAPAIAAAPWKIDQASLETDLDYDGHDAKATLRVTLARADGTRYGALDATVALPLRIDATAPPKDLRRLAMSTPITGTLVIDGIDLKKVPFATFGMRPPLGGGLVTARADLSGTARAPRLGARLDGRGLVHAAIDGALDAGVSLSYDGAIARTDIEVKRRGEVVLKARGESPMAIDDLIAGRALDPLLTLDGDLRLPLSALSAAAPFEADLKGILQVRGSALRPEGNARLTAAGVRSGELKLGDLVATLGTRLDGQTRLLVMKIDDPTGGTLSADARLPDGGLRDLSVDVTARKLDLALPGAFVPGLHWVKARLDADLHVSGSLDRPAVRGAAHIHDGALTLEDEPNPFEGIELEARLDGDTAVLSRLGARWKGGTVHLGGSARLDGLSPVHVEGVLTTNKLPIPWGDLDFALDSKTKLSADRSTETIAQSLPESPAQSVRPQSRDVLRGVITVEEGTLRLPLLASQRTVEAIAALADIHYVDARAEREAAAAAAAAAALESSADSGAPKPAGLRALLDIHIPGPIYLRGKEVNCSLAGDLSVESDTGRLAINGSIETTSGWVSLSDQKYNLTQARASFDGTSDLNPAIFVQLDRAIKNAQLTIEVGGTGRKPDLQLRSDPPIYDHTQLITMIAAGTSEPASAGDDTPLDAKAAGVVSGLLLSQLKSSIGNYLPVEVLKLDLGVKGLGSLPQPRLEVGKYLLDSLYLSYVYQMSSSTGTGRRTNTHEAHLEFSFLRNFNLVSTFGDAAVGGIDLFWSLRF